ncbi:MAG: HEAT repeat domain-containing protein [Planctomycetota bacterium]
MDVGDLSDNPFSIDLVQSGRGKRHAVKSAVKLLVIVAVGFSITLAVTQFTPRWLVQYYSRDFDSLPSEEKRSRLLQLADLGQLAIPSLVNALADSDPEVARTAHDLLSENQNSWTVLPEDKLRQCHSTLARSIQDIAVYLPDDRTGWASSLLQQTIQYSVSRRDEPSRLLYDEANHALEMLAISDRAGPSILSDEPLDESDSRLLVVQSDPLPVNETQSGRWTDWPPPTARGDAVTSNRPGQTSNSDETTSAKPATSEIAESPSVYRSSSARLRPVDPNQPVILHDINASPIADTRTQVAADAGRSVMTIQQASNVVDSPMGSFDDRSVMHWLGSQHRELREKARNELVSRGFKEHEITIATQIVSGDLQTRLALIDAIARSNELDPRPWLLMFLKDESRDVKLRAVSVLATMKDPGIKQQLQLRVTEERDPTVAARIRRVLNLR